MTIDLRALMHAVAEAAAKCVAAKPSQTQSHVDRHGPHFSERVQTVELKARAGDWRVKGEASGPTIAAENPALDAAAVLALRERVQRQRDERALLLAADDEALRVLDETARIYDAATVAEALNSLGLGEVAKRSAMCLEWTAGESPWPLVSVAQWAGVWPRGAEVLDACDAILRRRAAEAPQGGGRLMLPADVAADGTVTVRVPGGERP